MLRFRAIIFKITWLGVWIPASSYHERTQSTNAERQPTNIWAGEQVLGCNVTGLLY